MLLLKLYYAFFKIGLFSFGGGYAMIPFIQKEVVDLNKWLTAQEFLDIVSISQSTPGPIAINSATFVGYNVGGIIGSIIATLGVVSPSFFIVWAFIKLVTKVKGGNVFNWFFAGVRPVVVALILSAAYSLLKSINFGLLHVLIFASALLLLYKTKINSIFLLLAFGVLGIFIF